MGLNELPCSVTGCLALVFLGLLVCECWIMKGMERKRQICWQFGTVNYNLCISFFVLMTLVEDIGVPQSFDRLLQI